MRRLCAIWWAGMEGFILPKSESHPIQSENDVVLVRQAVRRFAAELKFNPVDQTKIVTAASELARNALVYGGGGTAKIEEMALNGKLGLRVIFEDQGPGIPDLALALKDGFTTGGGLGLGLSGSKRLMNEFDIQSQVGQGTRVMITHWKGR